ncbi:MAG: PIG-L deacetylase family protein [Bacteroidia bacterium]|nr:PIG-L deacetylase family protein [Bacteroidia bacterium]
MKSDGKKLMAVFAHPDDESLMMGGALAKYAAEGVETYLLMATRGERGRFGVNGGKPGIDIVGKVREQELRNAARELQMTEVSFLNYLDGDLDKSDPQEIISRIAMHIRRLQPQVVVTFGPDGAYGHPDHVAISQFTTAAIQKAADPTFLTAAYRPHTVSKLYYLAWTQKKWDLYQESLKKLTSRVDEEIREVSAFPAWYISTYIDARAYWKQTWNAIQCHRTQMEMYDENIISQSDHMSLWGEQQFYRVFSTVNGGRAKENDLFEGIEVMSALQAPSEQQLKSVS